MKEHKVCSFTRNGYRLQLLKITENDAAPYYEIRENRRITGTYCTIEAAHKKFMSLTYLDTMQKRLNFDEVEPIQAPNADSIKNLTKYELYYSVGGYTLMGTVKTDEDKEKIVKALNLVNDKRYPGKRYISTNFT